VNHQEGKPVNHQGDMYGPPKGHGFIHHNERMQGRGVILIIRLHLLLDLPNEEAAHEAAEIDDE